MIELRIEMDHHDAIQFLKLMESVNNDFELEEGEKEMIESLIDNLNSLINKTPK